MNTILISENIKTSNNRVIENAFNVNDQYYDLILMKSGEVFSVLVKNTPGKIHFHEQEIAEQFGIQSPTLDHLLEFIYTLYSSGLNLKRTRDYQIKLLVEGSLQLFLK